MSTTTIWEYCAIRTNINQEKKVLKYFSEGKAEPIEDVHAAIARLGQNGWEMITLTQISEPDARVYYFKRPVH